MGIIMNVNYRVGLRGSTTVGWPLTPSAYTRVGGMGKEFHDAGYSAVLFAPFTKGSAGQYSAGYDLFDPYDAGSKPQPYGIRRTAFGTLEELRQCIASLHADGLQSYGDLVLHQYLGGDQYGNYKPLGSDGVTKNGRFPKTDKCFVGAPPRVQVDDVPDQNGNFAFGDMASYQHSLPAGYMHDETIKAAQWLTTTTGVDGWRIDDAKGTYAPIIYDILHSPGLSDKFAFGEYFDGSSDPVANWVFGYMKGRCSVMDFATKFNIGNICNNNSRVWMGQLSNIGYCIRDAFHAITFIESADSSTSPGQQTIYNKILGYAIMLTFPGYPMVYFQDWSTDPGCFGLKSQINTLVWIHENLVGGDFVPRLDTDPQVFVHERLGWGNNPGCLCAFNNDQFNDYTRTVQTNFGAYQQVHEFTGNGPYNDIWTDGQGRLTFTVPRNNNGMSYLVFAKPHPGSQFNPKPIQTVQTFYGSHDLDLPPLTNSTVTVGRIFAQAGHKLSVLLDPDQTNWTNLAQVELDVTGPHKTLGTMPFDDQGAPEDGRSWTVAETGWHTITITSSGLPDAGSPFSLKCTYMGGSMS